MLLRFINMLLATAFKTEEEALKVLVKREFLASHIDTTRDFLQVYSAVCKKPLELAEYEAGIKSVIWLGDSVDKWLRSKFYANTPIENAREYDRLLAGLNFEKLELMYLEELAKGELTTAISHRGFLSNKVTEMLVVGASVQKFLENHVLTYEAKHLINTGARNRATDEVNLTNLDFADDDVYIETTFDVIYLLIIDLMNNAKDTVTTLSAKQTKLIIKQLHEEDFESFFNKVWSKVEQEENVVIETLQEQANRINRTFKKTIQYEFQGVILMFAVQITELLAYGLHTGNKQLLMSVVRIFEQLNKRL